uniref:Uncharacterized protein n=1 Tax=uncultured Thiotrichaceae bacterium TaxID=298394 RepID=A0A6S6UIP9_9GAMM|nr:MAG: Unknown protein [uncultured Thiotrichaceae bacterium]
MILDMDLSYGTRFCVASEILWVWSEFYGKHKGCKYWSEEALRIWPTQEPSVKGLVHEHLIPRKVLIHKLFNEVERDQHKIYEFLEKFCIGVVVTKAEDQALNDAGLNSKMPDDWNNQDPWARYTEIGLSVVEKT